MLLRDKVVMITGAGAGLGAGIARVCYQEGARVVIADLRAADAEAIAAELGERAVAIACDVRNEADQEALVYTAQERWGRVDGLVNNAGVNFAKAFLDTTREDWDRVIETDLAAVFFLTQKTCRVMLEQEPAGGAIVNIGSVHTLAALPGAGPYDAAKWGVVGMGKSIAVELAARGIRVNAVSPGLCNTQIWADIMAAAPTQAECMDHWRKQIPLGRVIEPYEIGQTVAFLLSDRSSATTGANLLVDGGMTSQLISKEPYEPKAIEGD
jgi:NAD(P)-dependent dehydrogenase (short-subunit alcohol dehydrogenase family)